MAGCAAISLLFALAQVAASSAASHRAPQSYCGYNIMKYKVTSGLGYITTVFRLNLMAYGIRGEQPVLLQHSFGHNADSWFQLGKNSLPCLLAEAGYDVWVANARGTKYSQEHTSLDPIRDEEAYWKFGFHEMAVEDLPATIDRILRVTKRGTVSYVGHGMGGTMIFILLSRSPAYNKKINVAVTFVPTCFTSVNKGNLLSSATFMCMSAETDPRPVSVNPSSRQRRNINDEFLFESLKKFEYLLNMDQSEGRVRKAFRWNSFEDIFLEEASRTFGWDTMSLRTLRHLGQLVHIGDFVYYYNNMIHPFYKPHTTQYRIENIRTRQFIMYSDKDEWINEKGALKLCSKLRANVRECTKVRRSGFYHNDFLTNQHAKQYVYDVAMRALHSQSNGSDECLVAK